MDREIRCEDCDCYLGVIRDAKLRKDIIFVCKQCYCPEYVSANKEKDDEAVNMLKNMFGMR